MKKLIIILVIIVAIIAASFLLPLEPYYNIVLEWVEGLGFVRGSTLFILFYILCVLLFLPGVILTIFAGYQHGVLIGTLLSCIGGTLGAMAAFYIGRFFLANRVRKWAEEATFLRNLTKVMDSKNDGWKIVLLLRISPLTPYSLLNYLLSVTKISTWKYLVSTAIGMIPGTAMYCYLGTTAKNIKDVIIDNPKNPKTQPNSPKDINVDSKTKMWIMIGGLILTIIIAVIITLVIRRALNKAAAEEGIDKTEPNSLELEEYEELTESLNAEEEEALA